MINHVRRSLLASGIEEKKERPEASLGEIGWREFFGNFLSANLLVTVDSVGIRLKRGDNIGQVDRRGIGWD
jgi:hypothetical protein